EKAVVPEGEAAACPDCSPAPFWDTMSSFKEWMSRRYELTTLRSWAGGDVEPLSSDVEDPYWLRFEMLWGWFRPARNVPAMLTTSVPQSSLGILGNDGTRVLFGGGDVSLQTH